MTRSDKAAQLFAGTYNCSQAVLASFAPENGLTEDQSLKLATAFGGGMARTQMTCGAITGALMAIGLHSGRGADDDYAKTGSAYEKALELFREFKKRNGSITCRELLQGLDMNDGADQEKIQQLGLFKTDCARYVRDAVEITEKIMRA
jgi:C_GCAxxG_C_C family probable redox protein